MKQTFKKYIIGLGLLSIVGCTDLNETPYDFVIRDNFYQTHDNVIQGFLRPFGHAYWMSGVANYQWSELSSDHLMTPHRQGHWLDGQAYFRMHYHTWTIDDWICRDAWNSIFRGTSLVNSAIADMEGIEPEKFGFTRAEIDDFISQLRTLRVWMFMMAFDIFQNIPIVTEYPSIELPEQNTPAETFKFLENELLESIPKLSGKEGSGGNGQQQGLWTKAGAAALLSRLYINAEWMIGENRYDDCAVYCEKIINGEYGSYNIAGRWDAVFDWNNETCEEVIYAFTSSYGHTHWVYEGDLHWNVAPFKSMPYFGFLDRGDCNPKFALQPGLDLEGKEYPYANGKPVRKFMKYPDDVRLKKYRNLGNSTREGLFLYGSLPYNDNGTTRYIRADNDQYQLYIRDQVGWFEDTDTLSISPNPSSGNKSMISDMDHADQSSGWYMIKYPIYRSDDAGKMESDYVILRLPEVYYMLAEVKFRKGDKGGAAKLLNAVRKRNYPEGSQSLYNEDGSQITEQEMVDEWGREFLCEGQRRRILCRFGLYNTAEWWDKKPDGDDHTMFMPIPRDALNSNPKMKQNPGYPDIN